MKLRSFFSVLIASVLVLLLIGAGGWTWLVARSPLALLAGKQAAPAAAMFVPRQAPVMVSLLVNPDRLEALRQVITAPAARRRSRAELNQLKQNLLATGLDYEQDVQPWLGEEITLAVTTLDIDRQSSNGQQPGYLLVLETRDTGQSQRFLQRFWENRGGKLVSEQYQGVKLVSANPEATPVQPDGQDQEPLKPTATAIVGDRFVLFANHPKVLRSAINNVQVPDLGLEQATDYRRALASFQQGWIGLSFLNLPQLAAENTAVTVAQADDSLAIAFGLNRQGILAETALVAAAGNDKVVDSRPSHAGQALQYVPASSPLAVSGIGLDQLWSEISTRLLSYNRIANLVNPSLRDLRTGRGLDLPQDIFAWVKGEYALGMLPHPNPGREPRPDWLFVAETTDTEQVQQAMQHLDAVAEQQGLGVGPLGVAEGKISAWTQLMATTPQPQGQVNPGILQARVIGAHGTVDNYQVMATSLEAVDQVLKAPDHALSTSGTFKAAIAPLPTPSEGYLYLDWPASRLLVEQQFPLLQAVEVAGQPFFRHLRSLALGSYGREAGVHRGKLFIRLS